MIFIGMRTVPGLNGRELWQARCRRVKRERECVGWALKTTSKPCIPCSVLLTRCAPSGGLDDDNLTGALKGVRDAIAEWLGVDDKLRFQVRYRYAQRRGPWGVEISFGPPVTGAQYTLEMEA
jgi:hypothetical protein